MRTELAKALMAGRTARVQGFARAHNAYSRQQWAEWFLWDLGWREMDGNYREIAEAPYRLKWASRSAVEAVIQALERMEA